MKPDCDPWMGPIDDKGYGDLWHNGQRMKAHRLAWMKVNGDIPDGLCILHDCDNPRCVNVAHLSLGTQLENIADRQAKGRQAKGSGHGRAKLTEAQVKEIRGRTAPHTVVVADYGVAPTTVLRIRARQIWTHV